MAITIPILTDFNGQGIDRGIAKFKQLEGTGAKAGYAIKKAALPAGVAVAALGAAAFDAVKGAMADQAAQEQLARTLQSSTKATRGQVAAVEDYITQTSMAAAVSDDELRPALATLARGTGDLEKAQKGLGLALDIAAGTGRPLAKVSEALSKAYAGNLKGLTSLDPRMKALIKDGATAEEAIALLSKTFKGDAAAAADTAQGKFKGLGIALEETKESVGAALLPAIEAVLGPLQAFGAWAQRNPKVFLALAGAMGAVATAVLAINAAMKIAGAIALLTNPIGLIIVAVAALTAGVILLYKKSETFRDVLEKVWAAVKKAVEVVVDYFDGPVKAAFDVISGAISAIVSLVKGDFSGVWEGLKTAAGGVLDGIKETLLAFPLKIATAVLDIGKAIVTGIASGVSDLATKVWDKISGLPAALILKIVNWVEDLGNIGSRVITYIVNGVTSLASAIWNKIDGFASALLTFITEGAKEAIVGIGEKIVGWIVSGVKAVASGIADAVKAAINLGIDALNKGISGLNKGVGLINAIIPGGDPVPDIPKIPRLARGGIVTQPTLALIGEAGPEAVVPLNRAGGMGGITINIEAGLVSTPDQVGQQIIEAIQRAQRRSGPAFAAA
jgi:hypothetical protein